MSGATDPVHASAVPRRARIGWFAYAFAAVAAASYALAHWMWAVALRGPVMYGEGAVAHAALLARDRLEYTVGASIGDVSAPRPLFTAANYPPLYFHIAALGDPFVIGRIVSIASVLFVAGAIAWRARPAGRLVAPTLALAWLASVPVIGWAPAVKPDLLALGLTVGGVMALDAARPRHLLAGALLAAAALTKPTALLPAAVMLVFVARRSPTAALRGALGMAAGAIVLLVVFPDYKAVKLHVIDWNALAWSPALAAPLVLIALLVVAVPVITILVTRPSTTIVTAYVIGAIGILLLGGREGATINYFLDLSAALALALAGRAPRLRASLAFPLAATAQLLLGVLLLNPFDIVPLAPTTSTGKWGDPARIAAVASIPGMLLVEDSGLLVASAREPLVDDVFLWSRNRAREDSGAMSFAEGDNVLRAVRDGVFDAVVSEVDLARVGDIGGFEAQRWHPDLVVAVLDRYAFARRIDPTAAGPARGPLYVYTRR